MMRRLITLWWTLRTLHRRRMRIILANGRDASSYEPGQVIATDGRRQWRVIRCGSQGELICVSEPL